MCIRDRRCSCRWREFDGHRPYTAGRREQGWRPAAVRQTWVEGIVVGRNITFADLKGTLLNFANQMYGEGREIRFRKSYFPFTEPSVEVDVSCMLCGGKGCHLCKHTGWLEILGAGMIHPVVLQNGGYDPAEFSGFAFGMGIERQTMLKRRVDDIRHFFANDVRFLERV